MATIDNEEQMIGFNFSVNRFSRESSKFSLYKTASQIASLIVFFHV